jgi:hypothetical protein
MAGEEIYQLKVTLKGSKPPIWRRIQVAGDTRLDRLHLILQTVMGWENYHLHQFIVGGTWFGEPSPDDYYEVEDERRVTLARIARGEKFKFTYEYDFGDGWEHELLVEKILAPESGAAYPRCLTGKRACPPEDVGGVWGYADFLEAVRNPSHPEHKDMQRWAGGNFDPAAFDLAAVNLMLQQV